MPIYEYACADCQTHFETLVQGGAAVACPTCRSGHVNRLLSVVGIRTQGAAPSPMTGGGGCCGGGCGCH